MMAQAVFQDISAMIEDSYGAAEGGELTLYYRERPSYKTDVDLPVVLPEDVVIDSINEDKGIVWSFDLRRAEASISWGAESTGSRESTYLDKYKIRHEFVAEAIQRGDTDRKLKEVFSPEHDEDDHLTPDFIWTDHLGHKHIIEIATTRNDNVENMHHIFQEKQFKYLSALSQRVLGRHTATFTIIVVSHYSILSSIKLDVGLRKELIMRFNIGIALEDHARSIGVMFESSETDAFREEMERKISSQVDGATYKPAKIDPVTGLVIPEHPLSITEEYVVSLGAEPDGESVLATFLDCYKSCKAEAKSSVDEDDQYWLRKLEDYSGKNKEGLRKSGNKPVVNLPLFLPSPTENNVDIPDMHITHEDGFVESKIWEIALNQYMTGRDLNVEENPTALICEALETSQESIRFYQESRKSRRSKYHRVNIASGLTSLEKEIMAEQGLWAKRFKKDEFYKARRKHTQLPFSWDTPVSDIDDFLSSPTIFDCSTEGIPEGQRPVLSLLERGQRIAENSGKGLKTVESWMSTKLFRSLDFISDMATELVIANKQNCTSGQAIVKKLRFHNAFLLVFPTKSSEHVFFTLYFPEGEELQGSPFRECVRIREGWITRLCSAKQGKLENWCSASSSLIALASFWSWFYELDSDDPKAFRLHEEARKMLLLTLLIRLEDKACTEEAVTQMRYSYMEVFKGLLTPIPSRPLKMLGKFSTNIRSRLELWVLKNSTNHFLQMAMNPPYIVNQESSNLEDGEDALPKDFWSGLLNCYTGKEVPSASKLINLMYLGYLKNKDESPEGNTDFALVKKTLEEEMKLDWSELRKSMGEVDSKKEEVKGKQFSKNCITHGCHVMEKRMEKKLGPDWKKHVGADIIKALSCHMSEELATLKASSSIAHHTCPAKASYTKDTSAMRVKVLEAIHKKLEILRLNPFSSIVSTVEFIENTSEGVIADLFKKQQHGGLREIYVLTLESRLLQLFVETSSRTLCSYFDEETLTHPKNKLMKLDDHRRLVARLTTKRSCLSVDLCSSSDKTRWNQNFVMPAMIIPLIRLTPKMFHPLFTRILNLWTTKLIKMPQSVLNLLLNRVQLSSNEFKHLSSEFWEPAQKWGIMDSQCSNSLRLTTGMMQGILHYTSSLLHLCFLNSTSVLIKKIFQTAHPDYLALVTQVCSSDDSGTILSILTPEHTMELTNSHIVVFASASLLLESLPHMCKYYCMIDSVKSTNSVLNYIEFNSEFMFDNTIAMPVVKYVAASQSISESESFVERFHMQYNLLSDLFSSGFTAEHTHLCQIAQALLHYKTLGSGTNALFSKWAHDVYDYPDPKYGFFLFDSNLCPGVLGYSYCHWKACTQTPIFEKSVYEMNTEPWVATPEGGIMQTLIIKHGEVKRWRAMADRIVGSMSITAEIEKNPEILFRKARTMEELKLKLAIKATSPGVAKSMRRGNPFIQAMAMSVYAINTHAFTKMSIIQAFNTRTRVPTKVCILGELDRLREAREKHQEVGLPSPDSKSLRMAFPNLDRYLEAQKVIDHCKESTLIRCHRFRHRRTEVVIQTSSLIVPLSLFDTLAHSWFGMRVRASNSVYQKCLNYYTNLIPWLRSNIIDTLRDSPFTTYQELFGFISTDRKKSRLFRRNGPGYYSRRMVGQLLGIIRTSQRPSMVMRETTTEVSRVVDGDFITKVNLGLSLPNTSEKPEILDKVLCDSPLMAADLHEIDGLSRRDATLAYIQSIRKGDLRIEDVVIHMQTMGLGTHVAYVREQKPVRSSDGSRVWVGEGDCFIIVEGSQVRMTMRDDVILSMSVDDPVRLRYSMGSFREVMRELGLKPNCDSSAPMGCIAKFNGKTLASPTSSGTQVKKMRDTERMHFSSEDLRLKYTKNAILLTQGVRDKHRNWVSDVTVLKYNLAFKDIIQEGDKKAGELAPDLWSAWLNQKSIDPEAMIEVLCDLDRLPEAVVQWLKETLQARLQFLQKAFFNLSYYETVDSSTTKESEVVTISMEEIRMILDGLSSRIESGIGKTYEVSATTSSWVDDMGEEKIERDRLAVSNLMEYGMDTPVPLWAASIHNLESFDVESAGSVVMPTNSNFMSLHSMWDVVIRGFEKRHGTFWKDVMEGTPLTSTLEESSKCFIKLLGTAVEPSKYPARKKASGTDLDEIFSQVMARKRLRQAKTDSASTSRKTVTFRDEAGPSTGSASTQGEPDSSEATPALQSLDPSAATTPPSAALEADEETDDDYDLDEGLAEWNL